MHGRDRSTAVWTAAAVFAVAAVVAIFAAGVGPITVIEPGWLSGTDSVSPDDAAAPRPIPTVTMTMPGPTERPSDTGNVGFPWEAALIVLLIAAAVLVVVVLRRLPASVWRRGRRSVIGGSVEQWPDATEELRAGARTAADMLSGPGTSEARTVVEAWLALESAAAASGAARDPAQTPSEFTAALLRRHHADAAATSTLLGLYHRARFSAHPDIGAGDVAAARSALETILQTISRDSTTEAPS